MEIHKKEDVLSTDLKMEVLRIASSTFTPALNLTFLAYVGLMEDYLNGKVTLSYLSSLKTKEQEIVNEPQLENKEV